MYTKTFSGQNVLKASLLIVVAIFKKQKTCTRRRIAGKNILKLIYWKSMKIQFSEKQKSRDGPKEFASF